MYLYYCSSNIINNLVCNNNSNSSGGGIYMRYYYPYLLGNTIVNNFSNSYGGGIYSISAYPTIKNCIIWGNDGSAYDQIYPTTLSYIGYSDIQGGYTGTANLNSDPLFVSPTTGAGTSYNGLAANWGLQAASPCIDIGYELENYYYSARDLAGNYRFDGDGVDLGGYEYNRIKKGTWNGLQS